MATEWECVKLEHLVDPDRGISYGIVQPGGPVGDGVPIIRVSDIRDGRISTSEPLRVSPAIEAGYARTRLRGGELLLTLVGTVGEAAVVPESLAGWNTARAVAVIPVRKDIGSYWVKLALRSPSVRQIVDSRLNTTVQATLNLRDVAELPIALPPQGERDAITHILGTLDEKIELNRRMSETLEAMARAVFKSWFVDFDPVRAKTEGRSTRLPPYLDALFPDSFEESELAEIPAGWEWGMLSDLAWLNPEAWSTETRPPVINYVDLSNAKLGRIETITAYAQEDAPSRAQRLLRVHDTIVGTVRPGNRSYAFISDEGLTGSTGFVVLRPQQTKYAELVYLAATATENIERLAHLADGAAYPAVRPEVVASTRIAKAPSEIIESFLRIAGPLLAKLAASDRESKTLALMRDTLLPKLMSGEVRVQARDRCVAECR